MIFYKLNDITIDLDEIAGYNLKYHYGMATNLVKGIITLKTGAILETKWVFPDLTPEKYCQVEHFCDLLEYYGIHQNLDEFQWNFDLDRFKQEIYEAKMSWEEEYS